MTKNDLGKIESADGYAYLLDNIARFGDEIIVVRIGGRTVYFGSASEIFKADKFIDSHKWTLCARVYEDDGIATVEA